MSPRPVLKFDVCMHVCMCLCVCVRALVCMCRSWIHGQGITASPSDAVGRCMREILGIGSTRPARLEKQVVAEEDKEEEEEEEDVV